MISIDVSKHFPSRKMNFNLELTSNRIILFGQSGSGKTTLLKIMAGFCCPDNGRIMVNNTTIFAKKQGINIPVHTRHFGYLPQDYTLFPHLNIRKNILYGLKARKMKLREDDFNRLVEKTGIGEKLSAMPATLSGGQQQRVALARIMLINPGLLLLDEPFSALDSHIRESLRDLLSDLTDETGTPAMLVTHDLEEALDFGREIVIIANGEVIEHGPLKDIFQSPRYVETARLMNFQVWPVTQCNGSQLETRDGERLTFTPQAPENIEYAGIRPEHIMLVREDILHKQKNPLENIISGEVMSLRHRARYIRIELLSTRGETYLVHAPEHVVNKMAIHKGKSIRISLKPESLVLLERKFQC